MAIHERGLHRDKASRVEHVGEYESVKAAPVPEEVPSSVPSAKTGAAYIVQKLITREDPFMVHKVCGIFVRATSPLHSDNAPSHRISMTKLLTWHNLVRRRSSHSFIDTCGCGLTLDPLASLAAGSTGFLWECTFCCPHRPSNSACPASVSLDGRQ